MEWSDALSPVLAQFSARARVFFTGKVCERERFDDPTAGTLHLLRSGTLTVSDAMGEPRTFSRPSVVFYPHGDPHEFDVDGDGANLCCASVRLENAAFNPIAAALPRRFECSLSDLGSLSLVLEVLFAEAEKNEPGRQEVLDRLFEIVLIGLLRSMVSRGSEVTGLLRGMAHPSLGKALAAIHEDPARDWSLASLARVAGMSRSSFAATFRERVGCTPGAYLTRWRICTAQALLRRGGSPRFVGQDVGYTTRAGFLRAFKSIVGTTPNRWLGRADDPPGDDPSAAQSARAPTSVSRR